MKVPLVLLLSGLILGVALAQEKCVMDDNCELPDCQCASTASPFSDLPPFFTPQFVMLSFDDAVTVTNFPFYEELLDTYTNPNDCEITMTFFLTHLYNDYALTNELHRRGNEIAIHSVSHEPDVEHYWRPANYTVWTRESVDLKQMLSKYGYIPEDEMTGFRAPFLEIGGDEMFQSLVDNGFKYDCSWSTLNYTNWYGKEPVGGLFPYTLDYSSPQDCLIGRCPKSLYPGFWVAPMLDLQDNRGEACAMLDTCIGNNTDCAEQICEDNVFEFLKRNFEYNYKSNRAPFGLYTHHAWFILDEINESQAHTNGYKRFVEYVTSLDDVWLVSINKVIEWMQNPIKAPDMADSSLVSCSQPPLTNCPDPIMCSYTDDLPKPELQFINMNICSRPCPKKYPWLGNVDGN